MSLILSDSAHYSDIANAIRYKNHKIISYKPSEMADAVLAIEREGSLSNDPNMKDIFNHGNIVGLNPNYAYYADSAFTGINVGLNGTLQLMTDGNGNQYLQRIANWNRGLYENNAIFWRFYIFNIQYSKVCFDCEVVDGQVNNRNESSIMAMYSNTIRTDNFVRTRMTNGGSSPVKYNMDRQVVKVSLPTNELKRYWIGFSNTFNTLRIYSIWLEP